MPKISASQTDNHPQHCHRLAGQRLQQSHFSIVRLFAFIGFALPTDVADAFGEFFSGVSGCNGSGQSCVEGHGFFGVVFAVVLRVWRDIVRRATFHAFHPNVDSPWTTPCVARLGFTVLKSHIAHHQFTFDRRSWHSVPFKVLDLHIFHKENG